MPLFFTTQVSMRFLLLVVVDVIVVPSPKIEKCCIELNLQKFSYLTRNLLKRRQNTFAFTAFLNSVDRSRFSALIITLLHLKHNSIHYCFICFIYIAPYRCGLNRIRFSEFMFIYTTNYIHAAEAK